MKMNYEAPVAEVISFTSMEQLASLKVEDLGLGGIMGTGSRDF